MESNEYDIKQKDISRRGGGGKKRLRFKLGSRSELSEENQQRTGSLRKRVYNNNVATRKPSSVAVALREEAWNCCEGDCTQ